MLVVTVQVHRTYEFVPKNGVLINMFKFEPDERGNLQYVTTLHMTKEQTDELATYGTIGRKNMNAAQLSLYNEYINDQYNQFMNNNQNNNSEL
jgi:hypothetical protein